MSTPKKKVAAIAPIAEVLPDEVAVHEDPRDALSRVRKLAEQLSAVQKEIEALEANVGDLKILRLSLEREDLPLLMAEIGMASFELTDGSSVTVTEEVDASISEARRPAAFAWLIEHGFSGLIKTEVAVQFDRGAREGAVELAERLAKDMPGVAVKEVVAAPTLKAFVKEQLQSGNEIPFDLFGIFPYSKAKIQPPKKPKAKRI